MARDELCDIVRQARESVTKCGYFSFRDVDDGVYIRKI